MAYIKKYSPLIIMDKLGYGKAEYYRLKHNAVNSVMQKLSQKDDACQWIKMLEVAGIQKINLNNSKKHTHKRCVHLAI